MKKVILCPNPYRDSELRVCKEAKKLLDALHFQTVVCLPFQREGYGAELGLRITPLHQEIRSADLLIAFGGEAHWARCAVVFFAVSAAFGGAVYAASMLAGVSPGSGALVTVSGRVLALSFAVCYAAVSTVFRRRAKTAAREVRTVTVTLAGRSTSVRALRDSGNDLHDPVSGLPAAVVERAAVLPLFPALHALPDDAVQTLTVLGALPECTGRVVLLPYRAVGVTGALLPAFRPDSVMIDGAPEPMLLALSAQALTSDGAFSMVLPPKN